VETGFAAGQGKNPEVFSGAVNEPLTTAVPQQSFGTALIPTVVTRGLIGWKPDVPHHTIELSPQLPTAWDRLVVHHAAAGASRYEIEMKRTGGMLSFMVRPEGTARADTLVLRAHLPLGSTVGDVKVKGGMPLSSAEPRQTPRDLELTIRTLLTEPVEISVEFTPGYEVVLPSVVSARGDRSRGIRLLDQRLVSDALVLTLEGPAGTTDTLSVRHAERNPVPVSFPVPGDPLDGYSRLMLRVPVASLH
jgi:hypothetical protein